MIGNAKAATQRSSSSTAMVRQELRIAPPPASATMDNLLIPSFAKSIVYVLVSWKSEFAVREERAAAWWNPDLCRSTCCFSCPPTASGRWRSENSSSAKAYRKASTVYAYVFLKKKTDSYDCIIRKRANLLVHVREKFSASEKELLREKFIVHNSLDRKRGNSNSRIIASVRRPLEKREYWKSNKQQAKYQGNLSKKNVPETGDHVRKTVVAYNGQQPINSGLRRILESRGQFRSFMSRWVGSIDKRSANKSCPMSISTVQSAKS